MRERFAKKPTLRLPPRPSWLKSEDGLCAVYEDKDILLSTGKVYFAYIVQANTALFKTESRINSAASIIYAPSEKAVAYANSLRYFGKYLYSLKKKPQEEVPEWLREVVGIIADEHDRASVSIRAGEDSDFCMDMTFLSLLVFREHLPQHHLCGNIVPIIAAPESCKSALILPAKYWTKSYTKAWNAGQL